MSDVVGVKIVHRLAQLSNDILTFRLTLCATRLTKTKNKQNKTKRIRSNTETKQNETKNDEYLNFVKQFLTDIRFGNRIDVSSALPSILELENMSFVFLKKRKSFYESKRRQKNNYLSHTHSWDLFESELSVPFAPYWLSAVRTSWKWAAGRFSCRCIQTLCSCRSCVLFVVF